jgi:sugar transferase (PEP-CTERM/EpsH1 system associated)
MDSRPLIAHVVYRFSTGGLENVIVSLINRLPAENYRHAIISLTEITDFRERITRPDIEYIALNKGPGHAIPLYPALFRYFRRAAPAIVHTCNLAALEAAVPAWLARVPVRIHAEHGWTLNDREGLSRKYRFLRRLYRPFVNHYVAVSPQLAAYVIDHVGVRERDVSLIFNGVDTDRFEPQSTPGQVRSGCPFIPGKHWIVGTVGRMQQVKNQTLLARAFVRALRIEPAAAARLRLIMVGEGPLREEVTRILVREGLADLAWLPGECSDVAELMRTMHCFVLPSLAEGTSCTLQEAMASSLPVIATAVGGNADLVTDGVTGTMVPPDDVEAMARAMLVYSRNPIVAAAHGAAGRVRMKESFSIRSMVSAYDRLFANALVVERSASSPRAA